METKKYFVFDEKSVLDFNIVVEKTKDGVKYSLFRSKLDHWSSKSRGELCLTLIDDGNGIIINDPIKERMSYQVFAEFYILMSFITKSDNICDKYKIVENKESIIL